MEPKKPLIRPRKPFFSILGFSAGLGCCASAFKDTSGGFSFRTTGSTCSCTKNTLGKVETCSLATEYGRAEDGLALKTKGASTCTCTSPGWSGGVAEVGLLVATITRSAGFGFSLFSWGGVGAG